MSRKFFESLKHDFINQENGLKTSIYYRKNPSKPLAVLIHGFNGNAFGMSFLAQKMSKNWQVIIVEMPTHGKSDAQKIESSDDLQSWNNEIISKIKTEFGDIALLICHSMSCFSPRQNTAEKFLRWFSTGSKLCVICRSPANISSPSKLLIYR